MSSDGATGPFSLVDKNGNKMRSGERGLLVYKGGTVCDDGFGELEASAICGELGQGDAVSWEAGSFYQDLQETLEIKLDNVICPDPIWSTCSFDESHNCQHSEDVFLTCLGKGADDVISSNLLRTKTFRFIKNQKYV